MARNVIEFIRSGKRCFDGATGTMLMKEGLKVGKCPENVSKEAMIKIHRAYIEAGAQFITTNTFGGSRTKLRKYGLADKVSEINRKNAGAAREAAEEHDEVFVAGDIGPTGEFIEPYGDFTREDFEEVFSEQARALAEGGADIIIIETMTSLEEIEAAISSAKKTGLPVIACMTFSQTPNGEYRTMMGVSVSDAIETMEKAGADVLGTNCTLTPPEIIPLVKEMRSLTDRPILAQPNAGQPRVVDGKTVYETIPDIEQNLREIIEAGVDIAGGCCGTDPDYIRTLRGIIDRTQ